MGQRPKLILLDYGDVADQIKGNDACCNMVASILPIDIPNGCGQKVEIQLFQKMIMLQIKLGITNSATCKHIFCPYTHHRPLGWHQRSKQVFFESSHVAYHIKGNRT